MSARPQRGTVELLADALALTGDARARFTAAARGRLTAAVGDPLTDRAIATIARTGRSASALLSRSRTNSMSIFR